MLSMIGARHPFDLSSSRRIHTLSFGTALPIFIAMTLSMLLVVGVFWTAANASFFAPRASASPAVTRILIPTLSGGIATVWWNEIQATRMDHSHGSDVTGRDIR